MKIFHRNAQAGNIPVATALITGGVALTLSYVGFQGVVQKTKLSELNSQKNFLVNTNAKALNVAATLFGSGNPGSLNAGGQGIAAVGTPAPVYPPLYYPANGMECEQAQGHVVPSDNQQNTLRYSASPNATPSGGQPIVSTSMWSGYGVSLVTKGESYSNLNNSTQAQTLSNLKNGVSSISSGQTTSMTVAGYNCDVNGLIKSARLVANTAANAMADTSITNASNKLQSMVAEVPVSPPPYSDCIPYVVDANNSEHSLASQKSGVYNMGTITTASLKFQVRCNNVVAKLDAQEQGASVSLFTPIGPIMNGVATPANTVSTSYQEMGVSASLASGTHNITVVATQPSGETVLSQLSVTVKPPRPPSTCAPSCPIHDIYYADAWEHSGCYEANNSCGWGWPPIAETHWICYEPAKRTADQTSAYNKALSMGWNSNGNSLDRYGYLKSPSGDNCSGIDCFTGIVGAWDPESFNGSVCTTYVVSAQRGMDFAGCFVGETNIKMEDGSLKRADAIQVGDKIYNPLLGRGISVNKVIAGPEMDDLLNISIDRRTVKVSREHPFMTSVGPVAASTLAVGDQVLDVDGAYHAITAIRNEKPAGPVTVYNYVLDGGSDERSHLLVGDGLLSGDIVLQNQPVDRKLLSEVFDSAK